MSYKKLEKPKLVYFDQDIEEGCRLWYYDDGSRSDGDSGYKCRSRSKKKMEPYCNCCDCPLCKCVNLSDLKKFSANKCESWRRHIVEGGHKIEDFESPGATQCLNGFFGADLVIQYYELFEVKNGT